MRVRAVAFDIIDTVFELEPLRPALEAHGLDGADVETLYAAMLRDTMALASAGGFAPLADVLGGALDQLRANRGLSSSSPARDAVLFAMRSLPPFPDAGDCFRRLKDSGIAVHALSNGARASTQHLIEAAGFADLFDAIHSVEKATTYKPHPSVYRHALDAIGLPAGEVMMIATHAWDLHGAKRVGMTTGFVRRGQDWPVCFDAPDLEAEELSELAETLLRAQVAART